MNAEHTDNVDQRIDELFNAHGDAYDHCLYRTAQRIAGEVQRLARSEQRVIPYLRASFHLMNSHQSLLDPEVGRATAIELIALLESPERARLLQPDFPEAHYEFTVGWMSACAYDNLATATGQAQGYNSEGMHGCIADGIQVCRRTGKLECITCFREYATDVYTAADDLPMALHHARSLAGAAPVEPERDRRWVGACDETNLLLLGGQLEAAEAVANRALALAVSYHSPLAARLEGLMNLESILALAGQRERFAGLAAASEEMAGAGPLPAIPAGEYPDHEYRQALLEALIACCQGEYDAAIRTLSHWDRWLSEHHCLHKWFEARLRLIAAHRLAGHADRVEALARPLEKRARQACDWLTLRRLARLLDPAETASPIAAVAPLTAGPFAPAGTAAPVQAAPPPEAGKDSTNEKPTGPDEKTPLWDVIAQLIARLEQSGQDPAGQEAVLTDLLAVPPGTITHPYDAGRLIYLLPLVLGDHRCGAEVWKWAEAVADRFATNASVLNVTAALGHTLRTGPQEGLADLIPGERVAQLFRQSLDLDPHHGRNFGRAGVYYFSEGQLGEAERCLARAFRLDRTDALVALRLAEVYKQTERPRDALAVLDMCLREGCAEPAVAWEAALTAFHLDQFESMLTYLDRHEALQPGQPWANFYRAIGLLELARPEEVLAALDEEDRRSPDRTYPLEILRACAAGALGRLDECRDHVGKVLAVRLATVNYLTVTGLASLFARLWTVVSDWPEQDPLRATLVELLLASGLAPGDLFEGARQREEVVEGIRLYQATVRQPLDDNWAHSPGCLAGQESWTSYRIRWGVLARDEEEAAHRLLQWQGRCYRLPAAVEEMELGEGGFTDKPGVVWQGFRWAEDSQ